MTNQNYPRDLREAIEMAIHDNKAINKGSTEAESLVAQIGYNIECYLHVAFVNGITSSCDPVVEAQMKELFKSIFRTRTI